MYTYVSFNFYPRVLNVYGILGADMNANYQIIKAERVTLLDSVLKNKGIVFLFSFSHSILIY